MLKKLILAAAGLMISAPVLADGGHRHYRHYAKHHPYQHYHRYYRPVVVVPPRVIYYPPLPHGISIRLNFPL